MRAVLERVRRERFWAVFLFLAAAALIMFVQRLVVPQAPAPTPRPAASENSG